MLLYMNKAYLFHDCIISLLVSHNENKVYNKPNITFKMSQKQSLLVSKIKYIIFLYKKREKLISLFEQQKLLVFIVTSLVV